MKRHNSLIVLLSLLSTSVFAQGGFTNILSGSAADAKYLAEGYISPFMKAFGYGMNNGWYTSGAPHKLGGFELTLTSANVYVPTIDKTYFVDNAKLTNMELLNGNTATSTPVSATVPTAFGSADVAPTYRSPKGVLGTRFQGPKGINLPFLPTPALSLGIGLPKGFELKVRYMPTLKLDSYFDQFTGSIGMFGIGVMHDIKQYIPGIKALPFDISAFVGFTKLNLDLGFDSSDPAKRGEFACTATTIQALISKKLSVLTVYGSMGYNIAKTDLALKGSYDFNDDGDTTDTGEKDPFVINTDSNGLRATIGLRVRLAVIAFHADYTVQKYNVLTGGFGINFR